MLKEAFPGHIRSGRIKPEDLSTANFRAAEFPYLIRGGGRAESRPNPGTADGVSMQLPVSTEANPSLFVHTRRRRSVDDTGRSVRALPATTRNSHTID